MRKRMVGTLLALLSMLILLVGLQYAATYAQTKQRELYLDRLSDTARLSSVAEEALDADDKVALQAELDRLQAVYGIHSAVLDRGGSVPIASTGSIDFESADLRLQISSAAAGLQAGGGSLILPWDSRDLTIAEPVSRNGDVVGVVITSSPTGALHRRVLWGWALISTIGLVALIAFWGMVQGFVRWVLRPVLVLDDTAHQLASGRYDVRVPRSGGPPELRRLARSFNEMADTVETSHDQQRAFVADASHQLRNPLNALLLRLQYLQITGTAELNDELRGAEAEGWRLARLVDELLALARAEQSDPTSTEFDLVGLISERAAAVSAQLEARGLHLRLPDAAEHRVIKTNRDMIGGAFDELLSNAIKYIPDGGSITVDMCEDDHCVILAVTDNGPGLTESEWALVGNRFWRGPQQQNVPGFGLGLSIARALVENVGGTLLLGPVEPHGLRGRIVLPVVDRVSAPLRLH